MPANKPTQGSSSSMLATRVPSSPPTPLTKTRRPAAMIHNDTQTRRQMIGRMVGASLGVFGVGAVGVRVGASGLSSGLAGLDVTDGGAGASATEQASRITTEAAPTDIAEVPATGLVDPNVRMLTFPVDVTGGNLVIPNRFGGYSGARGDGGHNGIDIGRGSDCGDFTALGQPLVACAAGQMVDTSFDSRTYGLKITLRDAFGNHFHYHHLDSVVEGLGLGDPVEPGQVVGFVGTTGNTRWAHLHFEVWVGGLSGRRGGRAVDPEPWLPLPMDGVTVGSSRCD